MRKIQKAMIGLGILGVITGILARNPIGALWAATATIWAYSSFRKEKELKALRSFIQKL